MTARRYATFVRRLSAAGLRQEIESRALEMRVSLRDLYEGPRTPTIVAARRDIYARLVEEGRGINGVARLFDRAPNGVHKMVKG